MIGEQYENNRRIFISNLYNDYEAGLVYPCIEMQGITAPLHPMEDSITYAEML